MTEHVHTISRRHLLNAAPAAMVLAGSGIGTAVAAHAPQPDAELTGLCFEYQRLHALAYLEGNDAWEAAHHESWQVVDKINDLAPVTQAGHRAKAAAAVAQMEENRLKDGTWMGGTDELFALNMLKDWLGEA